MHVMLCRIVHSMGNKSLVGLGAAAWVSLSLGTARERGISGAYAEDVERVLHNVNRFIFRHCKPILPQYT